MKQLTESQIESRIESMFDAIDARLLEGKIDQDQYDFEASCINAWERSSRLTLRDYKTWNAYATNDHTTQVTVVAANAEDARLLFAWRYGLKHDASVTVQGPTIVTR